LSDKEGKGIQPEKVLLQFLEKVTFGSLSLPGITAGNCPVKQKMW